MNERRYLMRMEAQLDRWKADVVRMKRLADAEQGAARRASYGWLVLLGKRWNVLREKMESVVDGEVGQEVRSLAAIAAWYDFKAAMEAAAVKFK